MLEDLPGSRSDNMLHRVTMSGVLRYCWPADLRFFRAGLPPPQHVGFLGIAAAERRSGPDPRNFRCGSSSGEWPTIPARPLSLT